MLTPNERYRRWRAKHLEQARAKNRAYHHANKAKRIEYLKKRQPIIRERYRNDPKFRLQFVLRQRIRQSLERNSKAFTTSKLIGCSIEQLKIYLESKFVAGMSWENHGIYGWHIDHIKPCASFDLSDPEQQKVCFHFTNLQPLWALDNLSKGAR